MPIISNVTMADFISDADFRRQADEEKILTWSQLEQKNIFKVVKYVECEGTYGPTAYLLIEDKFGIQRKVWSPSRLLKEIKENPGKTAFFTSLGQLDDNQKRYNKFELVLK